jgi:hypothetical protein
MGTPASTSRPSSEACAPSARFSRPSLLKRTRVAHRVSGSCVKQRRSAQGRVRRSAAPNRIVRPRHTSPKRWLFKPTPRIVPYKPLISLAFNIRTKTGMVRLRWRKWAKRDRKPPEMGSRAGARGSEEWPQMPAFRAVPAVAEGRKKNVPTGETGGGRGTWVKHSLLLFQRLMNHTNGGGCCLENRSVAWRCPSASASDLVGGSHIRADAVTERPTKLTSPRHPRADGASSIRRR